MTVLLALFALGAGHGINPAMGWLFAVARGLQQESRKAVWATLGPLALGHALAMVFAIGAAATIGLILPPAALRWVIAALLISLGVFRLIRSRHIAYGGMRVNPVELTVWSFLMASAHGAGLMILPLVEGGSTPIGHAHALARAALGVGVTSIEASGVTAALVHTAGYLLVTAIIAVIVYERVGVRFLRKAWVNLDLIWAVALIVTGVASILL